MEVRFYKYNNINNVISLVGIVDKFKSFSFSRSYSNIGTWNMQIELGTQSAETIKTSNFIRYNKGCAGLITKIEEQLNTNGITLILSGVELKGIAKQRIIIPQNQEAYQALINVSPETAITELIKAQITEADDIRRIAGNVYSVDSEDKITFYGRFDNVAESIITIAEAYGIGWYADIENDAINWYVYKGKNRSDSQNINNQLILSTDFDSIDSYNLQRTVIPPNVALVAGQGEGINRATTTQGIGVGLYRSEIYVDARDVDNIEELPQRGLEALSEYGDSIVFDTTFSEGMIKQYRNSFELGDIGSIRNSFFVDSFSFRLTEITEVYEGNNIRLDATFGYNKAFLADFIRRNNAKYNSLIKIEK